MMSDAAAPEETFAEPAPVDDRPLGRRLVDTFVAPGRLFAGFDETPPWLGVLLIAAVLTSLAIALLPTELFVEQLREAMREAARQNPETAGMIDPERMGGVGRISGAVAAFFSPWITALLAAGVLALVFGLMMSGPATFRQYLGVTSHAALIPAVGALLTVPLQIATGDLTTQLSLSLLTPFLDAESVLFRVLQAMNIFTLWALAVVALGVHVLNRRIGWFKASAVLFGIFVAVVVTGALIAS